MKSTLLALVVVTLLVCIVNLLSSLGVIGGAPSESANYEYRVVNAQGMDAIGFAAVAKEEGIEPDEEGKMDLPGQKLIKQNLLARTISEIENEGWTFVSVTSDNHYIFRK